MSREVRAINKSIIAKTKSVKKVTDADMEKINTYAISELKSADVFVFSVVLCDNEIDRDGERFTVESLKTLEKLYVGKTAIMNHSMKTEDQSARTFKTELITDGRKNSLGEDYYYLKAWAYMVRTEKNADLIKEIEAGIKKETSVGCSVEEIRCSVCGANRRKKRCAHIKGEKYDGRLCFDELVNPTDAYEWSFVAVPAQKNAGVTKTFSEKEEKATQNIFKSMESKEEITLTKGEIEKILSAVKELEEKAKDGEEYRKALVKNVISLSAICFPEIGAEGMGDICKSLSTEGLRTLRNALEKRKTSSLPIGCQTGETTDNKADENNSSFVF
ncbi:MAG: hypothetical protein J5877_06705 [Clostridia bacterium]|nr:hypothetical protein [Clostridia bacterium]